MTKSEHLPHAASAILDLHRLLTIFKASESIFAMDIEPELRELFRGIERDEVSRILLHVAASLRIAEDRSMNGRRVYDLLFGSVGVLIPDLDHMKRQTGLDLREACNKILHSRFIEPLARDLPNGHKALADRVRMQGTKNGVPWVAEIIVEEFCTCGALALDAVARLE